MPQLFSNINAPNLDKLAFEKELYTQGRKFIAGLDEVGRGPLAGPVVAAAVILPQGFTHAEITDSKKLSEKKRAELYGFIYENAISIGVGIVDAVAIDRINILQASLLAMRLACNKLLPQPDYLLIDGNQPVKHSIAQRSLVKGDSLSLSIACASIVAKVTRDNMMQAYHSYYPNYGFAQHKGYPTKDHLAAIDQWGPCLIHRLSFRGVLPQTLPTEIFLP